MAERNGRAFSGSRELDRCVLPQGAFAKGAIIALQVLDLLQATRCRPYLKLMWGVSAAAAFKRNFLDRGVELADSGRKQRQIRTANAAGMLLAALSLPHVVLFALTGGVEPAIILGVASGSYLSPLVFNSRGWFWLGRAIPQLVASVVATVLAGALGGTTSADVIMFALSGWAFALFDARREPFSLLLLSLTPIVGFVIVGSGVDLGVPRFPMEPLTHRVVAVTGGLIAFLLFVLALLIVTRREQLAEDELLATVAQLRAEVTGRQAAELAALSARDEALAAERAKTEFLAVVSHELRTPMNGIIGGTELIADTQLDSEQRDLVDVVRSSSGFLQMLIEDILAFSSLESKHIQLARAPVDVRALIGESMDGLRERAAEQGLWLNVDIEPSVPHVIAADAIRLRQVVQNLVGNAIKFTPRGRVEVRVRHAPGEDEQKIRLIMDVVDTGIGVPVELRRTIFQRFRQADSSHTRRFGGLGLGLAITSGLVELMGGELTVSEGVEAGACFTFQAPFEVLVRAVPQPRKPIAAAVVLTGIAQEALVHALQGEGVRIVPNLVAADMIFAPSLDDIPEPFRGRTILTSSEASCRDPRVLALPIRWSQLRRLTQEFCQPTAPPAAQAAAQVVSVPPEVLIVEDNPVNQRVLVHLLRKLGVRASVAENGRDGLERAKSGKYALILMDVQMPEMDGLEATRRIRELADIPRPTIVGVSANAYPEDLEQAREAGMDGYLAKPIKLGKLEPVIAAASTCEAVAADALRK